MRAAVIALMMVVAGVPAQAASLNLRDVARVYCNAVISGQMEPVLGLLTADLRRLVEGDNGEVPLFWQGDPEPAETCMPVGNRGTRERPETVIAFSAIGKPTVAQTIVMVFIGGELRIDDVIFADGSTLRDRLAVRA